MPSTFKAKKSKVRDANLLDLNKLFWRYLFSKPFLSKVYEEYREINKPGSEFEEYFGFVLDHLSKIHEIQSYSSTNPFHEKQTLYCFKIYYFLLTIVNTVYKDYVISLPYGLFFNRNMERVSQLVYRGEGVIPLFLDHVFENTTFFQDNQEYLFTVYWENEIHLVLFLASTLKRKYNNIKIFVDLSSVNEQVDFSFWKESPLINRYVNGFKNTYYDARGNKQSRSGEIATDETFGRSRLVTRLFGTKCFWGKCSFCAINSRFQSDEKIADLNEQAKKSARRLVSDLKNIGHPSVLVLTDEAIDVSIMLYFAEQIITNKVDVVWSVRSRFSEKLTFSVCKILAASGLRFLGLGLESVNSRILKLMNKRERDYSKQELDRIISNCDRNGINPHAYFMIGFPSETKEETDETLSFIESQLRKRRYFTYSANVFYLMKGAPIHSEPDKYGIEIVDSHQNDKLSGLKYIDRNPGDKYSLVELQKLSKRSYSQMFFRNPDGDPFVTEIGFHYWDFLDRTTLFYEHKLVNKSNPYLAMARSSGSNDGIFSEKYHLLPLFFTRYNSQMEYYNPINERRILIHEKIETEFEEFINSYNKEETLRWNMDQIPSINAALHGSISSTQKLTIMMKRKMIEDHLIKLHEQGLIARGSNGAFKQTNWR